MLMMNNYGNNNNNNKHNTHTHTHINYIEDDVVDDGKLSAGKNEPARERGREREREKKGIVRELKVKDECTNKTNATKKVLL